MRVHTLHGLECRFQLFSVSMAMSLLRPFRSERGPTRTGIPLPQQV